MSESDGRAPGTVEEGVMVIAVVLGALTVTTIGRPWTTCAAASVPVRPPWPGR